MSTASICPTLCSVSFKKRLTVYSPFSGSYKLRSQMRTCTCKKTCCVHSSSCRRYWASSYRRRVRRSARHALRPASQSATCEGLSGPEKNTSLGGGGSVRFITPVTETSPWLAFHSSEEAGRIRNKTRLTGVTTLQILRGEFMVVALDSDENLMGLWGWCLHQFHKHFVESRKIQIHLDFDRALAEIRLVLVCPRQGVSVGCSVIDIHAHIAGFFFGDQGRIDPRGSGQFVPHVGTSLVCHKKLHQVLRHGTVASLDLRDHGVSDSGFNGDINRRANDFLPRRLQYALRGFRIEPEIKFVTGRADELRIVGLWAQASAHEDQALGQFSEMRIDGVGERQVRHGTTLIDGHFMRILVHHANEKVSGVLVGGFGGGLTLEHFGNDVVFVPPTIIPGAGECNFSIHGLPQRGLVTAMHTREDGPGHDRNVGAANQLQKPQGVCYLFVAPLVAADHGDPKNLHLRRLNQGQQGLHVAAAGSGTILIDDDLAALLCQSQATCNQQKGDYYL